MDFLYKIAISWSTDVTQKFLKIVIQFWKKSTCSVMDNYKRIHSLHPVLIGLRDENWNFFEIPYQSKSWKIAI